MEISKKQKTEILNATRHQLSVQHMDSLEYPNGLVVGNMIEKNTQAVFDAIDNLPNYAIHNVIARLRGEFRESRRFILEEMKEKEPMFKDYEEALHFMYDEMMGTTKEYFWHKKEDENEEVLRVDENEDLDNLADLGLIELTDEEEK